MKIKNLLIMTSMVAGLISISSCKKKGCTDSDASNFDSGAKSDDHSCIYNAKVTFWYDQTTSTHLTNNLVSGVNYYVDGTLIGSSTANVYYASFPGCASGQASVTKSLGSAKTQTFSYHVTRASLGTDIWSGNITLDAHNPCLAVQLTY